MVLEKKLLSLSSVSYFFSKLHASQFPHYFLVCKKKPVDFDDELKTVDVRYDNMVLGPEVAVPYVAGHVIAIFSNCSSRFFSSHGL